MNTTSKFSKHCISILLCNTAAAAAKSLVMSDSVRPHRQQPTRLPHPWNSPGKNTGVSCYFLLQCMKVKSESDVAQSLPTLRNPVDCSLSGSSIHGILQARVLEWGAIAFSICNTKNSNHVTLPTSPNIIWPLGLSSNSARCQFSVKLMKYQLQIFSLIQDPSSIMSLYQFINICLSFKK